MRNVVGRRILGAIGAFLVALGVGSGILTVYIRIHQGRGTEGWLDFYGQPQTWAGAAGGLIAVASIALCVSLVVWVHLWKRSRAEGIPMRKLYKELRHQK
jgi:hypothetical protein